MGYKYKKIYRNKLEPLLDDKTVIYLKHFRETNLFYPLETHLNLMKPDLKLSQTETKMSLE